MVMPGWRSCCRRMRCWVSQLCLTKDACVPMHHLQTLWGTAVLVGKEVTGDDQPGGLIADSMVCRLYGIPLPF